MARTRNADIDEAVLGATLELLGELGYADLSIGQVASRAGVHRPAVYRRWPSKRHLIVDAVVRELGVAPTPDTGDLRADLIVGITTLATALGVPLWVQFCRRWCQIWPAIQIYPRTFFGGCSFRGGSPPLERWNPRGSEARSESRSTWSSCSMRLPHRCTTEFCSGTYQSMLLLQLKPSTRCWPP